jgi:L-threonylcarbamoyladenylate synthase
MKILGYLELGFEEVVEQGAEAIKAGKAIVYPTDTLYGLGVDATKKGRIEKIFEIKGREKNKPISVLVGNFRMLLKYAVMGHEQARMVGKLLPGPYSLILESRDLPMTLSGTKKIAFRMPEAKLALAISNQAGVPITATSANQSGKPTPPTLSEISNQLKGVELGIDVGPLEGEPSTVIDMTQEKPEILREGRVKKEEVIRKLGF